MDSGQQAWRHNFHAVWPSLFATSLGLMAFLPILPLYIRERFGIVDEHEQAFWTARIYGVAPLAAAIAGPVWGALGDRVGKKAMAIRANLAIAATTALMPFAPSPLWLLLMRVVQGAFAGYVAPSMSLASHGAPIERHGIVLARLQVAMAAGTFLGPFLGAEVTHWLDRGSVFWITSVMTALAALRLWLRAHEVRPAEAPRTSFLRELIESSAALLRNRVFAGLLVLVALLRTGQNMLEPFVALIVRELGPQAWIAAVSSTRDLAIDRTVGVAFGMLAVAQWVFTPVWGRMADRRGPLFCLALLAFLLAAVLALTATVTDIDVYLGLRVGAAAVMAGSMTLAYAAASKRVAERRRTLAFAMVQSCMQVGLALGPQLGAVFATAGADGATDYRRAFAAAAAICAVAAVLMLGLRRLPVGDDP